MLWKWVSLFHPTLIRCSVSGFLFKVGNQSLLLLKTALAFLPWWQLATQEFYTSGCVYTQPAETGIPYLFRTEKIENRFWHSKISGKPDSGPEPCGRILEQSIGARNRLSYRPARLHRLAESISLESISGLFKSLKIPYLLLEGLSRCYRVVVHNKCVKSFAKRILVLHSHPFDKSLHQDCRKHRGGE